MEWRKARRLMVAVLLLLNLVLLCTLGYTRYIRQTEQRDAAREAAAAFETAGVELDAALIPGEPLDRQPLLIQRDTDAEDAAGAVLLPEGETTVEGGVRYRKSGEQSVIWRAGSRMEAVLTGERDWRELLQTAGFAGLQEMGDVFRVTQQMNELPVFNSALELTLTDTGAEIGGRWCLGNVRPLSSEKEQSLPGLLLNFLRETAELPRSIESLEPGYIAQSVAGVGVQLIPAWRVTGDTGVWYLSAMDGSLLTAE